MRHAKLGFWISSPLLVSLTIRRWLSTLRPQWFPAFCVRLLPCQERDKALDHLRVYLPKMKVSLHFRVDHLLPHRACSLPSFVQDFTDLSLGQIWKGLWMCMWYSDRPLVQLDTAQRIARLMRYVKCALWFWWVWLNQTDPWLLCFLWWNWSHTKFVFVTLCNLSGELPIAFWALGDRSFGLPVSGGRHAMDGLILIILELTNSTRWHGSCCAR